MSSKRSENVKRLRNDWLKATKCWFFFRIFYRFLLAVYSHDKRQTRDLFQEYSVRRYNWTLMVEIRLVDDFVWAIAGVFVSLIKSNQLMVQLFSDRPCVGELRSIRGRGEHGLALVVVLEYGCQLVGNRSRQQPRSIQLFRRWHRSSRMHQIVRRHLFLVRSSSIDR